MEQQQQQQQAPVPRVPAVVDPVDPARVARLRRDRALTPAQRLEKFAALCRQADQLRSARRLP